MKRKESALETLTEIRNLMDRSSRFLSLSGLSGVFAGIYALVGVFVAYSCSGSFHAVSGLGSESNMTSGIFLLVDAAAVLVLTLATAFVLTTRRASKEGHSIFDASAKRFLLNLNIPLVVGGILCGIFVYHGHYLYIVPTMLIFYGLSLINAGKYTLDEVRMLGLLEIILGLICAFLNVYELLFWAIGFGVLHIVYGTYMYFKYEK